LLSLWIIFYSLLKLHLLWKNSSEKANFENPYLRSQDKFLDKLNYRRILEA